jgi:large subunit ribosomal protein L5
MSRGIKQKFEKAIPSLQSKLGLKNALALPRLVKVVVSTGTGSFKDKKKLEIVVDRLAKITGQKPSPRGAKKAIATFKSRQGDTIGYVVTLHGARMYDFLDRLLGVALPRQRDFRGIASTAIDEMGNLTIGVKEHTVFPETSDEELKDVFGFAVTIVSTAKNKETATALFEAIGVPFKKTQSV